MADSLYKVATSSVGPDSKPIYDVFEGTRKLDLPEFQQRGLNIDQLSVGQAPTGFQSQFTPTVIPNLTAPKLEQALGSTPSDTNALFQAKLAEQSTKNTDLLNQALAKVKLSPQEVEAQNKLLGLQQIQESAIQGAQERPLSGTILKAGLASEIQNIASGNTRESLVNMRMQTQEAQTLNLLTNQRQQELDALKMQLDQGNLDTQNLFKAQQLSEDIKNAYFDKVQTLSTNAKNSLSTIIEKFNGLTIDQLSPESAAQIGALAQQAGIPMEIITQGMKVAKDQIDLQNAQENYKNQTSRINATSSGSSSGGAGGGVVTNASGKPLTQAQTLSLGYYERMKSSNDIVNELQDKFTGVSSIFGNAIPGFLNVLKSADRQKLEQAQRDFINAKLRQESGAAISPQEFESAKLQYFPQPGDTKAVLEQKSRNRQTVIDSQAIQSGQNPNQQDNDPLGLR